MLYLLLAGAVLFVIVWTSLHVEDLRKKVGIFLGLGLATVGYLWGEGKYAQEVVHHVFLVDYVQFIPIPIATVLIAALNLFQVRVPQGVKVGWFLLLVCPLAGNFATTWSLVPLGLSFYWILREIHADRWLLILMTVCIFSMNFMAMGTLAADPPQAYWAVKVSESGSPLGFFFPFSHFWPYLLITLGLYYVALRRLGVEFGSFSEIASIRPVSGKKALYGVAIAACVGLSITYLKGYEITYGLGAVCVVVALSSVFFDSQIRHNTLHWSLEAATIFIAFFSVVALAHTGLHYVKVSNQGMVAAVIGLTLGADNAAAFAAAYPQFSAAGLFHQVWYNLFNAVAYGGISPLGNGPQITLFLVIMTSMKAVTSKEVFKNWFLEASVFAPYLLVWTLAMISWIEVGFAPTVVIQLLVGLVATVVCLEFMDIHKKFNRFVDNGADSASLVEAAVPLAD